MDRINKIDRIGGGAHPKTMSKAKIKRLNDAKLRRNVSEAPLPTIGVNTTAGRLETPIRRALVTTPPNW